MAGSAMRRGMTLVLPALLAGCMTAIPQPKASTSPRQPVKSAPSLARPAPPPQPVFQAPSVQRLPGLEAVIEQNAAALLRQFGNPRLDVREGDMRKLQFTGEACVLDVFLYPLRQGSEPIATYVEARRASDGQDVDKAACVQALLRR
jgi:hypothetical protein